MIRDDLSAKLVHLTRGASDELAAAAFISIIDGRLLRGGSGAIKGGYECVCFSEAPISKLATILAMPNAQGMRYRPFGVMVEKKWLFDRGGRPAIYETDAEFAELPDMQKYRHVRYEPGIVDFTWEREWRIRTAELHFSPSDVTLVVPSRAWAEWAIRKHIGALGRRAILLSGMMGPSSVTAFPWHFAALEDLGVPIPTTAQPPGGA